MMGAGKSTVGRRLAQSMRCPFADADAEIEAAAGESIEEIFDKRGEDVFRQGEQKVIARLLNGEQSVLATGGGAFMCEETRTLVAKRGISVWLRAEFDLLLERVSRRNNRPLLKKGDPEATLKHLIEERYPYYELADITVDTQDGPHKITVDAILDKLELFYDSHGIEKRLP